MASADGLCPQQRVCNYITAPSGSWLAAFPVTVNTFLNFLTTDQDTVPEEMTEQRHSVCPCMLRKPGRKMS